MIQQQQLHNKYTYFYIRIFFYAKIFRIAAKKYYKTHYHTNYYYFSEGQIEKKLTAFNLILARIHKET